MDSILILDFGGQTTQLIGRRIRSFGVFSEIAPGNGRLADILHGDVKGIILSGSPYSSLNEDAPVPDEAILDCGLPILGICYGFQQIALRSGGKVEAGTVREYGRSRVSHDASDTLLTGVPRNFLSWMSHGDGVSKAGEKFEVIARSKQGHVAAARHVAKSIWGVQFHPEASHCEYGSQILENFAIEICRAKKEWTLERYLETKIQDIRHSVGIRDVLLLISGGVDSTVVAALLLAALPRNRVHLMHIDTGLMRKDESSEVMESLKKLGAEHLHFVDAADRFLSALAGLEDSEQKRKIIGDTFIRVQEEEIDRHLRGGFLLAQGTLYTDLIESGHGVGQHAQMIKSHHNVGTPLVEAKRRAGELLEPLSQLYKDEVRQLGELIGLPQDMVHRHPFPGPGLGIRIIRSITGEKIKMLQEADAIYIQELKARGLYDKIWQAFCVLLPVRSVGVIGDARDYAHVLALRAVVSHDGMTADVFQFPTDDLLEISARITNEVPGIGRVVYDVSSKPPATIEWE
ncbi:MAG: GMP synthase (glutamine-hydrolyzing) [spirochete symbiont of Stewartia floridana]|nr:MAG: GMP synthase (glutamine-hydrolyzing) [spirochete symbiont of Stewartia floridana]